VLRAEERNQSDAGPEQAIDVADARGVDATLVRYQADALAADQVCAVAQDALDARLDRGAGGRRCNRPHRSR
jgi:hypothetical protein